jgi:AcrR family transcriptional regulator
LNRIAEQGGASGPLLVREQLMAGRVARISADKWVETARKALVREGISGVRIDRLARKLGVTRGGFYHFFQDRDDLLAHLLRLWDRECRFFPEDPPPATANAAAAWIRDITERVVREDGYDPQFDMAIREWARSDSRAAFAVEQADKARLAILTQCFRSMGYSDMEAPIRANVYYLHQIGYYAIDMKDTLPQRLERLPVYLEILCGKERMAQATAARRPLPAAPSEDDANAEVGR